MYLSDIISTFWFRNDIISTLLTILVLSSEITDTDIRNNGH